MRPRKMTNKMTETKVKDQNHVQDLAQDQKQALQIQADQVSDSKHSNK